MPGALRGGDHRDSLAGGAIHEGRIFMNDDLRKAWTTMDVIALIGVLAILGGLFFLAWAFLNERGGIAAYAIAAVVAGLFQLGMAQIGRAVLITAENSEKIRKIAEDAWRKYEKG